MGWTLKYSEEAEQQLRKLDKATATRIDKYLRTLETVSDPRVRGKGLTGTLGELWRYRIGNYRAICDLRDDSLVILAIRIGHRSRVYKWSH